MVCTDSLSCIEERHRRYEIADLNSERYLYLLHERDDVSWLRISESCGLAVCHTVLLTSTKYFFFKFLKQIEKIGYYVDLANDQALVKYHYFWSCRS